VRNIYGEVQDLMV